MSFTEFAKIPGTSKLFTSGINPWRDKSPYDGFKVGTPLQAPGILSDPPVSDPNAIKLNLEVWEIFLPLRFYVKSLLAISWMWKTSILVIFRAFEFRFRWIYAISGSWIFPKLNFRVSKTLKKVKRFLKFYSPQF